MAETIRMALQDEPETAADSATATSSTHRLRHGCLRHTGTYLEVTGVASVGTLFSTFLLAFLGDRLRSSEASNVVALLLIYTFAGILLCVKDVPPWFSEFGSDDDEPLVKESSF